MLTCVSRAVQARAGASVGAGASGVAADSSSQEQAWRRVRQEQDDAYRASVTADARRYTQQEREEEEEEQEEEEEGEGEDLYAPCPPHTAYTTAQLLEHRAALLAAVPPEPPGDTSADRVVNIQYRVQVHAEGEGGTPLPQRISRRFLLSDTTDAVLAFIQSHEAVPLLRMHEVGVSTSTVVAGGSTAVRRGRRMAAYGKGNLVLFVR